MRKTMADLASYLKCIMPPEAPEAYAINPVFQTVAGEQAIREGVLALRAFLNRLFDGLIAKGDAFDTSKKVAHAYENRTTLSVYYPFLHHVNTLLIKIGYQGVLGENGQTLLCTNAIFNEKLSPSKTLVCLRFLTDCGICIGGVDLHDTKQTLSGIQAITVAYPDNPALLTGLKVMATAEAEHGSLVNQDIFLRCDYRVLKRDQPDAAAIVQDTIKPLPAGVQDFLMRLHQRCLAQGLTCAVEIKGFHIYIKYCYKRKDVWGLNASLNNGYHINVKAVKTREYPDAIQTFPPYLQDLIARGYGCGRKREIGCCDGGCRGVPIPLDDSVLDIQHNIVTWLDREMLCLQKK